MTGILGGLIGSFKKLFGWRYGSLVDTRRWQTAAYADLANGKYFAFGASDSGNAMTLYKYSNDGETWTDGTLPASIRVRASATDGTTLCIFVDTDSNVYTTANGTTWTSRTRGSYTARQAIWDGTYFLCVTTNTSTDGLLYSTPSDLGSWNNIDVGNGGFSIAYDGSSRYVVMSATSTATHRTNTSNPTVAANWSDITLPAASNWVDVVYGNGIWVAMRFNSSSYATSTNGTTWTSRTLPFTQPNGYNRTLFYDGNFYTYDATNTRMYKSSDGINWSIDTTLTLTTTVILGAYGWAVGPNKVIGVGLATASSGTNTTLIGS